MEQGDYIKKINGAERRFFTNPVEFRKDEETETIHGIAAKVGVRYDMGWYEEEVLEGAFDDALNNDIRCLFNHDPSLILARSNNGAGTLKVELNNEGHLTYSYKTPNRQYARDLADAVRTSDVDQSSWGFVISEQNWVEREGEKELRQIVKVDRIFDVSPVTYPANPDTTVAKRSFDGVKQTFSKDYKRKLRLKELKLKIK